MKTLFMPRALYSLPQRAQFPGQKLMLNQRAGQWEFPTGINKMLSSASFTPAVLGTSPHGVTLSPQRKGLVISRKLRHEWHYQHSTPVQLKATSPRMPTWTVHLAVPIQDSVHYLCILFRTCSCLRSRISFIHSFNASHSTGQQGFKN